MNEEKPDQLEERREIPLVGEYDVVIVGGGPAGIAAAISCGRLGVSTLLIERFGFLGGTATAALMNNINGFRNQVEPDSLQTVKGIAQEIIFSLHEMGGLGKSPYPQKEYDITKGELSYSYCVDPEKFKYVVLEKVVEADVDILFHTWFSMPLMDGNDVTGVIVENKSGRSAFHSKIVIDASGDGDVAARAGVPFWEAGENAKALRDGLMYKISGLHGVKIPHGCQYGTNGEDAVVWGPAFVWGRNDAFEISRSEIATRLEVFNHFEHLLKMHPELKKAGAYVSETPVMLGIRQTRFIEGDYKLTADDAIVGRRFEDVVAMSSCPIISYYGYRRYLEHEGYDIPYRCLLPRGVEKIIVAGRCISSEQQPYESHRAMAPVMAIGEAAGTAAALCCRERLSPRQLDVRLLQETLLENGAELGMSLR